MLSGIQFGSIHGDEFFNKTPLDFYYAIEDGKPFYYVAYTKIFNKKTLNQVLQITKIDIKKRQIVDSNQIEMSGK